MYYNQNVDRLQIVVFSMANRRRQYIKALETLVYVANKERRHYWALKVIYFADKEHLQHYGRQIFDESYYAMDKGPVPSLAYDIVKDVRGDGHFNFSNPDPSTALNVPNNHTIKPRRVADTKLLSKSEVECLDYAYDLIKGLSFGQLKKLSHDSAYDAVGENEEIPLYSIVGTLDNSQDVLDYLSGN
jgi:hypothetical protein